MVRKSVSLSCIALFLFLACIKDNNPVTINTQSFGPPDLYLPSNGATHQPLSPQVMWINVSGAIKYDIQVSRNSAFTDIVTDDTGFNANARIISGLTINTTYYWHVRARNSSSEITKWSSVWSFTTDSTQEADWTWKLRYQINNENVSSVCWGNNTFVVSGGGYDTSGVFKGFILTSTDGVTWVKHDLEDTANIYSVTWGNNTFVAVGESGLILTSPDGITWTNRSLSIRMYLSVVVWGNNKFIAIGTEYDTSNNVMIYTSIDGITWESKNLGIKGMLNAATWSNSRFVAVGSGITNNRYHGLILNSADGTNWGIQSILSPFRDITWGNSRFLVTGGDPSITMGEPPRILLSTDGSTWTCNTFAVHLSGLTYARNQFVTVGIRGEVLTSYDGIAWTARTSVPASYCSIIWGNNIFVVIGVANSNYGAIFTSTGGGREE